MDFFDSFILYKYCCSKRIRTLWDIVYEDLLFAKHETRKLKNNISNLIKGML